jgi:hypothetical protein
MAGDAKNGAWAGVMDGIAGAAPALCPGRGGGQQSHREIPGT